MLYIVIYFIVSYLYFKSFGGKTQFNAKVLTGVVMLLAFIVGMGDMLGGYDRYIYAELFDDCADYVLAGLDPLKDRNCAIWGYAGEMAYVLVNMAIAHITANRYIFILVYTLLVYILLLKSMRDYFPNSALAMLLFMGLFFFFTFTYLRQVMAVAFTWFSFRYVIKRKLLPYLACVFVAYEFHNSAIVFLPMYFIPIRKFRKSTILAVLVLLLVIGATGMPSSLYSVYGDISGTDSRTQQYEVYSGVFRVEYVLEVIVFLYFILKRYDKIPNAPENLVFLNASLMFFAIMLLFVTSSAAGRQTWFYMFGLIYTLNYVASLSSKMDGYNLGIYVITTLLFLRIVQSWGIFVSPYKTFLTDGNRDGDHIHERYEYDHNYDVDKLYRPVFYWK